MTQQAPTEEQVKAILAEQLNAGTITREQAAQKMSNFRKIVSGRQPTGPVLEQPRVINQPDPTFGERLVGDVQALGQIVGGAVAEPLAGLSGLAVTGITGDPAQGAKAVEAVRSFPEKAIPLNTTGQKRLEQVGGLVGKAAKPIAQAAGVVAGGVDLARTGSLTKAKETFRNFEEGGVSQGLGDQVLEITGDPELATAAFTLPSAALEAIGVKGARNLKGQTILGAERQILSSNPGQALLQASPSIDLLKKRASKLYDEIDAAKAVVDQGDYLNLAIDVGDLARRQGFDPRTSQALAPKTQALLQLIEDDVASNLTFSQIDQTRRMANVAARSIDSPIDKAIGSMVKDKIDDFLDGQADKLGKAGETELAGKFKQARGMWSKAKKAETLDELVENASTQASGVENGLRIGFRSLLKDKKKLAGFTTDERTLMKEIVEGTSLANTFKKIGKLGFGDAQQSNMLMASLGGGAGFAAGGPLGAITVPAIGTVSGKLATRLTANKSTMLQELTKAGPNSKAVVSSYLKNTPKAERTIGELTELLMRPEVDLSALKKGPVNQMVQDAVFAAEFLRDMGAANLMEVPAIIEGIRQEGDQ